MATIVNERDVILQATTPRMLLVASNFISLTPTTNTFSTTATSTTPTSILVRANLSGELNGTVAWTVSPEVPVTVTGNIVNVPSTSVVPGASITVTATLILYGQTYTASTVISNVAETVTSGLSASAVLISTAADGSGGVYTSATSTMSVNIGILDNSSAWTFSWNVPAGVTATGSSTRTISVSNMTVDSAALTCTATRTGWPTQTRVFTVSKSKTGNTGADGTTGATGPVGNKVATVFLYQWASAQPGNPSGQSTYTWNPPGNASYTGGNSWQTSISSNPGTPLLRLWVASTSITAAGTDTTTTVSWTTGFTISSIGQNGDTGPAGVKTAAATVFQWALTIPTISGTSTYTWSNASISPVPSGWTLTPGTPTAGFTLWEARVNLLEAGAALTSSINWATSSILAVGYAGQTGSAGAAGLSARISFARVANNPSPVTGNIVTSGTLTFPSSAQSTTTWGFAATWGASDPNPSSTDSLYQCDGIFNPATNQTTWTTPYISSLKVGSLSAITVNTGALTVQDTLTVGTTGSIRGGQTAFNTGTGFFLGYDSTAYKFSIGTFSVIATINTTQDTLTVANHGFLPGDAFYVLNNNGNTDFTTDFVYYVHSIISTSAFRVTSVANAGSSFTNLTSSTSITIAARSLQWTGTTLANYGKLDMFGDVTVLGNLSTFRQRAKLSPDRLNFYRQTGSTGIFNGQDVQTAQYDANGFFIYTDSKSAAPTCSISDSNGLPTLTITKRVAVATGAVVEIDALNGADTALRVGGRADVTNMIRTTGTATSPSTVFTTGRGLEIVYIPASSIGYVQSYNRDASIWTQLYLSGSRVTVNGAGSGGAFGLLGIGTENFGTSATNTIAIARASTAPTTSPTNVGQLYVNPTTGHLMFRHDNGTVYTLTV